MIEILILICLLLIIALLLQDRIKIGISKKKETVCENPLDSRGIMGSPKSTERHSVLTRSGECQNNPASMEAFNFGTETKEEDLDEVFYPDTDLTEEEEEWIKLRQPNGESGFASGVTFEELSTVGTLLQEEILEPSLEQQVVDIVQKIEGTELLNLLESSLENASLKIARLLDQGLKADQREISKSGNSLDGFDIGEFV